MYDAMNRATRNARGLLWLVFGLVVSLVYAGCATAPQKGITQFDPLPREEIGAVELDPIEQKIVSELLREAEAELRKANEAHEQGDHACAGAHYRKMLEIILDADLDPALYYASREQFDNILGSYIRHAHLYHHPERRIGVAHSGVYSDLVIPYPLPQPVLNEIEELQNSYPSTFQRGFNRSARYMPWLREAFREAGLPEDLAWLAMVESMFQPRVVSPAGAGGMWQFMRATGRRYDLRMDSYVDERYNWHSATRAATEYLKNLHDFFNGDWALAITAYNMGEGGLERAISANNGERCLWTLFETPPASDRIKQESKKFYPRLLAYIIVANAPEEYGFSIEPEPVEDVLRIPVQGSYQLADLDTALGLSRGTLARLNPDLLRETTPPQGEYPVAVPREMRDQFIAALKSVKSVQYAAAPSASHDGTHRVRRGETISQIAQRYGVCQRELMRINRIRSARALQANQVLQLPDSGENRGGNIGSAPAAPVPAESRTQQASSASRPANTGTTYTVKRGDTLSTIAAAHKIKVADLQKMNSMGSRTTIRVGQRLAVGEAPAAPKGPVQFHEVKPGEYPGIIAPLYGISVNDLLRWNQLTAQSVIRAGDKLVVAREAAPAATQTQTAGKTEEGDGSGTTVAALTHKVAPGETAGAIASRYGVRTQDLLAWNQLTAKSIIRVGQELGVKGPTKNTGARNTTGDVQVARAQKPNEVVHKVTAGQNPTTIARQYGVRVNDLFKWNNWTDRHVLRIGDEVKIYKD